MKVGVLCECSGTVRDAFLSRGHDAISCDLKPTEAPGPHIVGDCFGVDWSGFDLLICHPDCTYLASSGLHWNSRTPGREAKTRDAVEFARRMLDLPVRQIALENPVGRLGTAIRKADQIVQPYEFGDDASKATCLWLKGLPRLRPTQYVAPRIVSGRPRWANQTDSGQNRLAPGPNRKTDRSRTYRGIAQAMADQWGSLKPHLSQAALF